MSRVRFDLPLIVTRREVLAFFRISAATLRRQIKVGHFPDPWDIGPQRWRRPDLEAYFSKRSVKNIARRNQLDAIRLSMVKAARRAAAKKRRSG